jgi:hypothetical protein
LNLPKIHYYVWQILERPLQSMEDIKTSICGVVIGAENVGTDIASAVTCQKCNGKLKLQTQ